MGEIIDTEDPLKFIILMGFILFWILWTDIDVLWKKTTTSQAAGGNLGDWFKNIIDLYWPSVLAIFLVFLFIFTNTKAGRGGYITLFLASIIAIYFTSYTIYQWHMGASLRGIYASEADCNEHTDDPGTCRGTLGCTFTAGGTTAASCTGTNTSTAQCTPGPDAGGATAGNETDCTKAVDQGGAGGTWAADDCSDHAESQEACETDNNRSGCEYNEPVTTSPSCHHDTGILEQDASSQASEKCSIILPKSNNFLTKEYHFYRLIYYMTIIIIAACASTKISGDKPYLLYTIVFLPFIAPFFTEVLTLYIDYLEEKKEGNPALRTNAYLSPELLLIQFMRGDHSGGRDSTGSAVFQDSYWLSKNMTDGEPGVDPFINSHLFFSFAFYLVLILLLITYSQGYYGQSESNVPIYIALTFLIGFPFIMKNIFIQDCAYDTLEDNLPDGKFDPDNNLRNDETLKMVDVGGGANDIAQRLKDKQSWSTGCIIEKYGGIQSMACISLIILILCKTQQKKDKILVFIIMILLTYGLSQTLIIQKAYTTT